MAEKREIVIIDKEKANAALVDNPKILQAYVVACSCSKCGKC